MNSYTLGRMTDHWTLSRLALVPILALTATAAPLVMQARIKVMILTGQSNQYHNWAVSSAAIKRILEDAGKFEVSVVTSPAKGQDMSGFTPTFAGHGAVVMDYEGDDWPDATRHAFAEYIRGGGGLVLAGSAAARLRRRRRWPRPGRGRRCRRATARGRPSCRGRPPCR